MFEEAAESLSAPKLPRRGPRSGIERLVLAPLVRSLVAVNDDRMCVDTLVHELPRHGECRCDEDETRAYNVCARTYACESNEAVFDERHTVTPRHQLGEACSREALRNTQAPYTEG